MLSDPHVGEWVSAVVATFASFGIIVVVGIVGAYFVFRLWGENMDAEANTNVAHGVDQPPCRLSA